VGRGSGIAHDCRSVEPRFVGISPASSNSCRLVRRSLGHLLVLADKIGVVGAEGRATHRPTAEAPPNRPRARKGRSGGMAPIGLISRRSRMGPIRIRSSFDGLSAMDRIGLVFRAENEPRTEHEHEQTLTSLPTRQRPEDRRKDQPRNSG